MESCSDMNGFGASSCGMEGRGYWRSPLGMKDTVKVNPCVEVRQEQGCTQQYVGSLKVRESQ